MPAVTEQPMSGSESKAILFVGCMDYHANIDAVTWFSREPWPEIARTHPALQFMIVGRDPAPEVRAWPRIEFMSALLTMFVRSMRPPLRRLCRFGRAAAPA